MINLGIGLPCYGSKLDVGHAAMWLGLGVALASTKDKFTLRMMSDYHIQPIDLARNTIIHDAASAGCDWVLMVDADTFHSGAQHDHSRGMHNCDACELGIGDVGVDILQMIMDGDRAGAAAIGAPVRGRKVGDSAVCVESTAGAKVSIDHLRGNTMPVLRIGAAFLAVNLGWLQEHWPKAPWFVMSPYYDIGRPVQGIGEDYAFCDGVWDRGGEVMCDGRFVPEHVDRRKLVK